MFINKMGRHNKTVTAYKKDKSWEVDDDDMMVMTPDELDDYSSILHDDEIIYTGVKAKPISISNEVYWKIRKTMQIITDLEWSAFLNTDDDNVVDSIYFPKQKGTKTTVDFDEDDELIHNYRGIIHSHHNMRMGFSSTDKEGINTSYDFSILVTHGDNDDIELEACRHFRTKDGDVVVIDCDVAVVSEYDLSAWERIVNENFDEKPRVTTYNRPLTGYNPYQDSLYGSTVYNDNKNEYTVDRTFEIQLKNGETMRFVKGETVEKLCQHNRNIKIERSDGEQISLLPNTFRSNFSKLY